MSGLSDAISVEWCGREPLLTATGRGQTNQTAERLAVERSNGSSAQHIVNDIHQIIVATSVNLPSIPLNTVSHFLPAKTLNIEDIDNIVIHRCCLEMISYLFAMLVQ